MDGMNGMNGMDGMDSMDGIWMDDIDGEYAFG